jgi:energy-coupling factor transport system ATP-binding protein
MDLTVLEGPNFSGRSKLLRAWAGLAEKVGAEPLEQGDAYVGPDPIDSLSGLAPTVAAELELAAADDAALAAVRSALEELGFGYTLQRNPFTLSGGEQTVVAVLAAAAGRPCRLAIDSTLEQLAAPTRAGLLAWLSGWDGALMLADNRLDEWYSGPANRLTRAPDAPVLRPNIPGGDFPSTPHVEIRSLHFSYPGGQSVFKDFDLTLEAGKSYQLRGPNGVGKSTLSKILCGLLKPVRGEILVDGVRTQPWRAPGRLVSYHFQNPSLQLFSRTVEHELARSFDPTATAARFGLNGDAKNHPLDLPFVLRKRLALAAAIDRPARFLILDEPSLGQDSEAFAAISELVYNRGGLTITHSQRGWCESTIDL